MEEKTKELLEAAKSLKNEIFQLAQDYVKEEAYARSSDLLEMCASLKRIENFFGNELHRLMVINDHLRK